MFNKLRSIKRCKEIRRRILELTQNVPALHVGGSFSSVEIIESIYFNFLKKKINLFYLKDIPQYFSMSF